MVDANLLGLMAATLIFNFIMTLYLMVLMHKRKEEISYLIQRKEQLEEEVGRIGVELSLLQNKIKKLEEKA
jgi:hypothetical protein